MPLAFLRSLKLQARPLQPSRPCETIFPNQSNFLYLFRLPLLCFPVGGKSDGPLLFWIKNAAQLLRYLRQRYCHLPALFCESESSKLTVVVDFGIFSIGIIRNLPWLSSMTQMSALRNGFLITVYQPL